RRGVVVIMLCPSVRSASQVLPRRRMPLERLGNWYGAERGAREGPVPCLIYVDTSPARSCIPGAPLPMGLGLDTIWLTKRA
ncbi:hypothetical protein DFH09DRAFT_1193700, partial [Mycena vulgaris]